MNEVFSSTSLQQNLLTDGIQEWSYQKIPDLFDGIQKYFEESCVSIEDCLALECETSLASALMLLYLLERGYSFLLLANVVYDAQDKKSTLPRFCRYRVVVGGLVDDLSVIDLRYPKQFLTVVNNEEWSGVHQRANPVNPKVYLRT